MGAHPFLVKQRGKTAVEAYRAAVEQAEHEDGHSAYSGTIATTHGVVELPVPAGTRATTIAKIPGVLSDFSYNKQEATEPWKPSSRAAFQRKLDKARRDWPWLDLEKWSAVADEKWGSAVAVRVRDGEYLLFGMAAS